MTNSATTNRSLSHAKVFITSAYEDTDPIEDFKKYAQLDKVKKHAVVDNPHEADIILFIENSRYHHDYYFGQVKNHPLVKQYPDKVYMYNPHDMPWYVLPGMYASMPNYMVNDTYISAAPYIETINPYLTCDFSKEPEYLFSFFGAMSAPVRKRLVKQVSHPRAKVMASVVNMYNPDKPLQQQYDYADLLNNSKFVLCPRGTGTSSARLFEVMKVGRVPVILSDNWLPPAGANWHEFAIFVREEDVEKIPAILEKAENAWPQMSRRARQVWEEQFAPDTIFNYFVDCILTLNKKRTHSFSIKLSNVRSFLYWYYRKQGREYVKPRILPLFNLYKKIAKRD